MKKLLTLCVVILTTFQLSARMHDISTSQRFHDARDRARFSVVLIQSGERTAQQRSLNSLFESISKEPKYQEANVRFIRLNEQKDWVQKFLDEIGIARTPAIIVYDRSSLKMMNGRPHVLYGYVDQNSLQHFINRVIGADIQEVISKNKHANIWKLEQAKANYQERPLTYYYPCPGYFYPYWWYICSPGGNRVSGCGNGWCF